jgi:hypothetical protein
MTDDQLKRRLLELERKVASLTNEVSLLKERRGNDDYIPPANNTRPRQTDDPVLRAILKPKSYVSLD